MLNGNRHAHGRDIDLERAREALWACDPGADRETWHEVGRAAIAAGLSIDDVLEWSSHASNFAGERDVRSAFRGITPEGGTGPGTLFRMAWKNGWRPTGGAEGIQQPRHSSPARKPQAERPSSGHGQTAGDAWAQCLPADDSHGYIASKAGVAVGLRVVPPGSALKVAGTPLAGALVVPLWAAGASGDTPVSLQYIFPPDVAAELKAQGRPGKLTHPGPMGKAWFVVGEVSAGGTIFVVEGIGQAWACWKAAGHPAVVTFGAGRVRAVAQALRQLDTSVRLVLVPDRGVEDAADKIAADLGCEVVKMPEDSPRNYDACDYALEHGHDALEALLAKPTEPPLPFSLVSVGDLAEADPPPPEFVWDGLIPTEVVTLVAAHGGVGKSTVGLMLCIAVALGLLLFGLATSARKAAFFSGEDGAVLLRYRLRYLCTRMGVNPTDLEGRLFILDGTEGDPRLYIEAQGGRDGELTETFAGLRDFMRREDIGLLVLDNASDVYDASEIDRARVRAFMRALTVVARERKAGCVLLAHVDKGTSRGDRGPNSEGYSGSTAWHNSARSRLFLAREKDGALRLEHQKCNLGALRPPLTLEWPHGGIPQLAEGFGPVVQGIADRTATKALLKLINEFSERGEFVGTATTSRNHAGRLLRSESLRVFLAILVIGMQLANL
jgi:putative DNA primase/helicase